MQSSYSLKSLVLAVGLVLSAASPAVFAQRGEGHPGMGGPGFGGMRIMAVLDDVNATEAQRQQIEAIFKAARTDLKPLHQQGQQLHRQLLQAFAAPNVDANAVEALRKQQAAHHEQVSQRMSRAMVEAARILTPEQRAQWADKMGKRMERMQRRHEQHGRKS
ncbi:Spy/CpxP family protein refolding chaperone [Inhella gelatinilytica]|uniref:Spy/CpxP family protein refolding chaperone n=1 Tax=Inhella gelatinilytica TaxID=2795030 RepID=A0A931IVV8_9BURK|nr:Spy/CpxP family protein refolding chaperone [Inhella gelatinilytica]MBH9553762.1 Spy/CpxP family protein refolding chaperone [Inhella gelatinilytica]